MKPNELGRAAGFTKKDADRFGRAERQAQQALELLQAWEELTGEKCEDNADCRQLIGQFEALRSRMFETESEDELGG